MKKLVPDKRMIVWIVLFYGLAISVIVNLPGLLRLDCADIHDWRQFNALSLFTRSCLLHYKTLPMFDPWTCGGTDVLANPQNRIFSPLVLLDMLFPPNLANIVSLIVYGTAGFAGCFYLLKHLRVSFMINMVCSTLFVNAQWFGLHFAEGHIAFGSFLLIPWVLLSILNIDKKKYQFLFVSICALFILDGGFYPFIFTLVLFFACLLSGLVPYKKIFNSRFFSENWLFGISENFFFEFKRKFSGCPEKRINSLNIRNYSFFPAFRSLLFILLLGFSFFAIVSIKIIPLFTHNAMQISVNQGNPESIVLPFKDFFFFFCNPLGSPLVFADKIGWMYHELGCYIGIVMLAVLGVYLYNKRNARKSSRFLLPALFFFWIGTGWGKLFNPFALFQKIPLISMAHVQPRYLLIMYLFLIIILAFALQRLRIRNIAWIPLAVFLLAESFFVRMYPSGTMFESAAQGNYTPLTQSLITSTSLRATIPYGEKPFHYFSSMGSENSYETLGPYTRAKSLDDPEYRGESYFRDPGIKGKVSYREVTPGRVIFDYTFDDPPQSPAVVELNLNYLAGWKVVSGDARIHEPDRDGIINVMVSGNSGSVTIQYWPWYLNLVLPLYITGVMIWILLLVLLVRKGQLLPVLDILRIRPVYRT